MFKSPSSHLMNEKWSLVHTQKLVRRKCDVHLTPGVLGENSRYPISLGQLRFLITCTLYIHLLAGVLWFRFWLIVKGRPKRPNVIA